MIQARDGGPRPGGAGFTVVATLSGELFIESLLWVRVVRWDRGGAMRWVMLMFAVIAMAACGETPESVTGPPATLPGAVPAATEMITVSSDSELARMLDPAAPWPPAITLDGLAFPAGAAPMWKMSSEPSSADEARRLAEVVGVTGEVRPLDEGPGWVVGSAESGDGELRVSDAVEPYWDLQRSEASLIESGAIPCPTVAFDAPNSGQCANGAVPGAVAPADGDEVDAKVLDVMSTIGVDTYQVDINVYADFTDVVAVFSPSELRSDVVWRIGIANTGQITAGSGPLRAPVIAGEVTTVALDEAMLRLGRIAQSSPPPSEVPPASTIAVTAGPDNGNAVPPNAPVTIAPVTYAPVPFTLPTITSVEPSLASAWDISNVKWLVPALTVRGDAGFVTTVPIISSDFVRIVDAASVDVPVRTGPPLTSPVPLPTMAPPTTTSNTPPFTGPNTIAGPSPEIAVGSVGTLPVPPDVELWNDTGAQAYEQALTAVLLGLPIDDASVRLFDAGWTVRISGPDVTPQTVTGELNLGRATIQHRDGIVIAVTVG